MSFVIFTYLPTVIYSNNGYLYLYLHLLVPLRSL
jgi:hypothetical protein